METIIGIMPSGRLRAEEEFAKGDFRGGKGLCTFALICLPKESILSRNPPRSNSPIPGLGSSIPRLPPLPPPGPIFPSSPVPFTALVKCVGFKPVPVEILGIPGTTG
eukprot:1324259-Amorphochlora_amoeboformis.AAC.1